jgi:hypothetical protein
MEQFQSVMRPTDVPDRGMLYYIEHFILFLLLFRFFRTAF